MSSLKIPPINKLLNQLAEQITDDKFQEMKFRLTGSLSPVDLEQCRNPRDVFTKLKHRCLIGEHNLEFLEDLFNEMDLSHLIVKVQEFKDIIASDGHVYDIPEQQAAALPAPHHTLVTLFINRTYAEFNVGVIGKFRQIISQASRIDIGRVTYIITRPDMEVMDEDGYFMCFQIPEESMELLSEAAGSGQCWSDHCVEVQISHLSPAIHWQLYQEGMIEPDSMQMDGSDPNQVPPEILARGKEACDAFSKALKEGKTHNRRIPLMIVGQNRSGKTSLKKSLIREKFNPEEDSTQGIEVDPSLCEITTNTWRTDGKSSADDAFSYQSAKLVAQELKNSRKEEQPQDSFPQDPEDNLPTGSQQLERTAVVDGSNIISGAEMKGEETTSNLKDITNTTEKKIPEDISVLIEKLLYEKDQDSNSEELYLKIWDFAGQSVYYATHPVFFSPQAIYLLTHNLNTNLRDKAAAVVKQGSYKRKEDSFSKSTNMDVLHFWMSSIASLNRVDPRRSNPEKLPTKLPPVILVCTHGDKRDDTESKEVAQEILFDFRGKKYDDHLVKNFFIVDNTQAGKKSDFEDKEVQRLREFIKEIAEESLSITPTAIPLRWYQFENAIQSLCAKGRKHMELGDVKRIAQEVCEISDDKEFQTLLNFFHDNRMLIHFEEPKELRNLVILDTQWLIDVFKGVITVVPVQCQGGKFSKDWQRLETEGVLTKKFVVHRWRHLIQDKETVEELLLIMEKFNLLCKGLTDGDEELYLVPSMLMSHRTCEINSDEPSKLMSHPTSNKVPPLFVRFKEEQVPIGLFPRLLIYFVHWCLERWSRKELPRLFCDFARFYIGNSGEYSVSVASRQSLIKITILKDSEKNCSIAPICKELKRFLEKTFSSMGKDFPWLSTKDYEFCVQCTLCSAEICPLHDVLSCTQDICQHFVSEDNLRKSKESIKCYKCTDANKTTLHIKQFAVWFDFLKEKSNEERRKRKRVVPDRQKELPRQRSKKRKLEDEETRKQSNETVKVCTDGVTKMDKQLNILLLGSEWGSSKGGLSTFNRQTAIHLAKQPKLKVHCYLPEVSYCDKADAAKVNVHLIEASSVPGEMDPLLKLHLLPPELPPPDVIISHGRKFGTAAFFHKKIFPKSKWVHFVHVDCEEMGKYKGGPNPVAENNQKDKKELELCKEADLVVAVGPQLEEKYNTSLYKAAKKVEVFYPGLSEEFLNLRQSKRDTRQFQVYMFGRGAEEDFKLKGFDVAANAVKELGTNFVLHAVCAPSGEEDNMRKYFLHNTNITNDQLYVHEYCNDREQLKEMMCKASVVLMPSRAEAFGLIGLEALSAGVPVLVSAKSGFGIVLNELTSDSTYVIEGHSPEVWAKRIRSLSEKPRSVRNAEIDQIRTKYDSQYKWDDQCVKLADLFWDRCSED